MLKIPAKFTNKASVFLSAILALGIVGCGSTPLQNKSATGSPRISPGAALCGDSEAPVVQSFLILRRTLFSDVPKCDEKLIQLATLQRDWLRLNKNSVPTAAHHQIPGTPGFSGETLSDRIPMVGLAGHRFHIAETVSSGTLPDAFLQGHLASVFHRSIILAPGLIGFGLAIDEEEKLQVMTAMIDASGAGQDETFYPSENDLVPTVRNFAERPFDQLKSAGEGLPISVHFPWGCAGKRGPVIKGFTLSGSSGPVAAGIFSHHSTKAIRPSDVFLIPNRPLAPKSRYTVNADLFCGSRVFKKSWTFETL